MPHELIDYEAAAEQMLAVLSARAAELPAADLQRLIAAGDAVNPILAGELCLEVFGDQALPWQHESRRRRIRDTAAVARKLLSERRAESQILANGQGYWISTDAATIAHYAARRRHQGLGDLAAAKDLKPNIAAAAGQTDLFPPASAPIPKTQYRH